MTGTTRINATGVEEMSRYGTIIAASIIAASTAVGLTVRTIFHKRHFDKTVSEALKTSEGYDQKFIDMVKRLETELALRASFGYSGQKDPMTGKERIVVRNRPVRRRTPDKPAAVAAAAQEPQKTEPVDSVKLTAIIFDDTRNVSTAIVMVGERSFAIEEGDFVIGRRVTTINNERVIMEDDEAFFFYEITGRKGRRLKFKP